MNSFETKPVEIDPTVLVEAREFFEDRGSHGLEGTAMLAGSPTERRIDRLLIPDQKATRTGLGVGVEVTQAGKLQIAAGLGAGERWMSRIHSHPDLAFHSETDDRNPALTAEGSLSIVVPFYGLGLRHGLDACAVFVLHRGDWQKIEPGRLADNLIEGS
jgi:hypothetical protein